MAAFVFLPGQVEQADLSVQGRHFGECRHQLLEERFCLFVFTADDEAASQHKPGIGPLGIGCDGRTGVRDRIGGGAGLQVQLRQFDLGSRSPGIELQDRVERVLGVLPFGLRGEHAATRKVGLGRGGIRRNRVVGADERLVELILIEQHAGLHQERFDIARLRLQNARQSRRRLLRRDRPRSQSWPAVPPRSARLCRQRREP